MIWLSLVRTQPTSGLGSTLPRPWIARTRARRMKDGSISAGVMGLNDLSRPAALAERRGAGYNAAMEDRVERRRAYLAAGGIAGSAAVLLCGYEFLRSP